MRRWYNRLSATGCSLLAFVQRDDAGDNFVGAVAAGLLLPFLHAQHDLLGGVGELAETLDGGGEPDQLARHDTFVLARLGELLLECGHLILQANDLPMIKLRLRAQFGVLFVHGAHIGERLGVAIYRRDDWQSLVHGASPFILTSASANTMPRQ